jgi:hypothetical protein
MFKIQGDHHAEEEATWETESYLQRNFPDFLQANSQIWSSDSILFRNLGTRFFLGGEGCDIQVIGIKTCEGYFVKRQELTFKPQIEVKLP